MQKEKKENMFEKYFEWWLDDLKRLGLVKDYIHEPQSCVVLEPAILYTNIHYVKKESITASHNLMQLASYTRDYDVKFHKSLLDKFIGLMMRSEGQDDNSYYIKELNPREKGDTFYDFKYYYLFNAKEINEDWVTVSFDVKPPSNVLQFSGSFASARSFPYNQKLMLEKHNIMVNKVIPCKSAKSLFNTTFIPSRYMFTDGNTKLRKLSPADKVRTAEEWLQTINVKPLN